MQHLSDNHSIPQEVCALLRDFTFGIESALGDQLLGAYMHGSLALGGFDECSSDLDFLVATAEVLQPRELQELAELHEALAVQYPHWGNELEGAYVPLADLRQLRPDNDVCPSIERGGKLQLSEQDINYRCVHMYVLGGHGIVLCGPPPTELLAPVGEADLRSAVLQILRGWWAPMIEDSRRLEDLHYRSYAVQTMCRILYTLSEGGVVSKPEAADWAKERYGSRWGGLIDSACAWPRVKRAWDAEDACGFIRFALSLADGA